MRLSDPFGLIDLTRSFTATSEFVVAPVVDPLPPDRAAALRRSRRQRRQPLGRHPRRRRPVDARVPHRRRPAQDPLAVVGPHRRADGAPGGTSVAGPEHHPARRTCRRARQQRRPAEPDPRLTSSFEWAVSAVASIGTHVLLAGRKLGLRRRPDLRRPAALRRRDPAGQSPGRGARGRPPRPQPGRRDHAGRRARLDPDRGARPARPDGVAGAGRRARARALGPGLRPAARRRQLDRAGRRPAPTQCRPAANSTRRAEVLRRAGWRVTIVRRGDETARAWQLLLAGSSSGVRTAVGAR